MIVHESLREGKEIIFSRTWDQEPAKRQNYQERRLIGKGFSADKSLRKIGEIPVDFLLGLPKEEQEMMQKDPNYLRVLLHKYPQWRCSEGGI